jgi:hypothetical protein
LKDELPLALTPRESLVETLTLPDEVGYEVEHYVMLLDTRGNNARAGIIMPGIVL